MNKRLNPTIVRCAVAALAMGAVLAAPHSADARVPPCCVADFNCSGTLEVADIFEFLNAWFAGSFLTDLNGDGALQVADIFAFLNAWFAGC